MESIIVQSIIAISGAIAIWMTQTKHVKYAKYAPIIGLIGQPFWIHATWLAEQWGMFALTLFYTYAWLIGLNRFWFTKENKEGEVWKKL